MFQGIKVWNNQRRYRNRILSGIRDKHLVVLEMQESWRKHLYFDRKENAEAAKYWLGRYEGIAWMLKAE